MQADGQFAHAWPDKYMAEVQEVHIVGLEVHVKQLLEQELHIRVELSA